MSQSTCSCVIFESAAAAGVDFPGLSNFARTLSTVEKRLGVSTESLVTNFFLCGSCWKPHYPEELAELEHSQCDEPQCDSILYTIKRLSNGSEKRTPVLILPLVPSEKAIQRLCLQPGKVAQWQEWHRFQAVKGVPGPLTPLNGQSIHAVEVGDFPACALIQISPI
jgi:hypothetical protein